MTVVRQYFYKKGKAALMAVINSILSVLLILAGVYAVMKWDMSFLFTELKGYVVIIVYFLITLGLILSAVESFSKWGKTGKGIPALVLCTDRFMLYNRRGMQQTILFADCVSVVVCHENYTRQTQTYDHNLKIKYNDRTTPGRVERVEFTLNDFDYPKSESEREVMATYNNFRNQYNNNVSNA